MKFLKIILLAFFSAVSLFAISEEQIKPTMQKATQDAIEVLKNVNLSKDEKISKIFAVFDPYFDYEQMSKIALSKRYNNLSAEQKVKFNKAFEERLKTSYVDKLLSYKNQTINFKDVTKPNENRYFLNADLVGEDGKNYGFTYKFYNAKERGWLIYDVEILGVSIIQTYRSQFDSLMENESFENLLSKLNSVQVPQ
jgi:toluene tolerance protein ttg2D